MATSYEDPAALARRQQLYNVPDFSDITVICSGKRIYAHKAVLSISSACFLRTFTAVPQGSELSCKHDDPSVVERMLQYIYGIKVFPAPFPSTIHMDIALFRLADKYEIPPLLQEAEHAIAERLEKMKDDQTWTAATCAMILGKIYEGPKGEGMLRRLAAEACRGNMEGLIADDKFQETLLKFPEIAADLMKRPVVKAETQDSNKRRRI